MVKALDSSGGLGPAVGGMGARRATWSSVLSHHIVLIVFPPACALLDGVTEPGEPREPSRPPRRQAHRPPQKHRKTLAGTNHWSTVRRRRRPQLTGGDLLTFTGVTCHPGCRPSRTGPRCFNM